MHSMAVLSIYSFYIATIIAFLLPQGGNAVVKVKQSPNFGHRPEDMGSNFVIEGAITDLVKNSADREQEYEKAKDFAKKTRDENIKLKTKLLSTEKV